MSENDIRTWRESAAKPQELPTDRLIHRLVKTAYSHGWLAHKNGTDSESAERHRELVKNDRDELLRRGG